MSFELNCERKENGDDDSNDTLYSKCDGSNWYIYTLDPLVEALPSSLTTYDASLTIDSDDNPHIIYTTYNLKYSEAKDEDDVEYEDYVFYIKYAKKEANEWKFYNVAEKEEWLEETGYIDVDTSIAVDSKGKPHILILDTGLFYGTIVSGSWQLLYLGNAWDAEIATDSKNRVHIVCSGEKLRYITNLSGAWQSWALDDSDDLYFSYSFPSIAIDSADNVHIAYECSQESGFLEDREYLKYTTSDPNVASLQTIVSMLSLLGDIGYIDIATDSNNHPHISYVDSRGLKYLTSSGYNWTFFEIDFSPDIFYSSIATAPDDSVHIAYLTINSAYIDASLKYATNKTGTWQIFTLDSGADTGHLPSLAIDSNGCVHITYFNLITRPMI